MSSFPLLWYYDPSTHSLSVQPVWHNLNNKMEAVSICSKGTEREGNRVKRKLVALNTKKWDEDMNVEPLLFMIELGLNSGKMIDGPTHTLEELVVYPPNVDSSKCFIRNSAGQILYRWHPRKNDWVFIGDRND